MRYSIAAAAFAAVAAARPQGSATTTPTTPSAPAAPAGCSLSYPGSFEIQTVNVTNSKRDLVARQDKPLIATLNNGLLFDDEGRQGYIASNQQFQFNTPVQSNSIYVNGFSVCSNGTLAIGNSAIFYQCLSGGFYNLYAESIGNQCSPIYIEVINSSGGSAPAPASQQGDGQPTASAGISPAVCEFTDGQPQVTNCPQPVTQISDGQVQATTGVPVTQISDGQIQATTGVPVTQISDGQIQATTGVPVTQISDGQVQATTGVPVTQISDGQVQATTGVPVTQISDGQIQATTGVPVTQISDGQIQATTGVPVTQISDGQIQATTGVTNATSIVPYMPGTNAGPTAGLRGELLGLAAGVMAVALL